jgi:hypothetical protein
MLAPMISNDPKAEILKKSYKLCLERTVRAGSLQNMACSARRIAPGETITGGCYLTIPHRLKIVSSASQSRSILHMPFIRVEKKRLLSS